MAKQTAEIEVKVTGEKQAQSKLGALRDFIKSKFVITLGDIARIGKSIVKAFGDISKAATVQEDAISTLNQALKTQGAFTNEVTRRLQDEAAALQKVTTFGDEQIIQLQAQLISFGVQADRIKEVTAATLDLATSQKMDLFSAGNLIAKSVGSSTNALARYGIEVTGAVGDTERLDTLVKNISAKFGGQAAAATETYTGKTEQLANAFGDLKEEIGIILNEKSGPFLTFLKNVSIATTGLIQNTKTSKDLVNIQMNGVAALKDIKEDEQLSSLAAIKADYEARKKANDDLRVLQESSSGRKAAILSIDIAANEVTLENESAVIAVIEQRIAIEQRKADAEVKSREIAKQKLAEELAAEETMKAKRADGLKYQLGIIEQQKKAQESLVKLNQDTAVEMSDALAAGQKASLDYLKRSLSAQVDAWMAAEIGKLTAAAFTTFGASLAAIAPVVAAGSIAKGAINSVAFAQGGQFESSTKSFTTAAGQPAVTGERGIEIHKVETLGRATPSSGGTGGQMANITIQFGNKELKTIATELKPYLDAKDRSVF